MKQKLTEFFSHQKDKDILFILYNDVKSLFNCSDQLLESLRKDKVIDFKSKDVIEIL